MEWSNEVSDRSKLIDLRESWCGDRDGDTDRQCTPALHYTGYLVQTVCQYKNHETSYCGWSEQTPAAPQEVRSGEGTTVGIVWFGIILDRGRDDWVIVK